jgi:hypothetical protein
MSNPGWYGTPQKLSDIQIRRAFEVNCGECGCIDSPSDYETAVKSRREHFETKHQQAAPKVGA